MQGMFGAHWQAVLAAVPAAGGIAAAAAAAAAWAAATDASDSDLPSDEMIFPLLAIAAADCPSVVGSAFLALVQEACELAPQATLMW